MKVPKSLRKTDDGEKPEDWSQDEPPVLNLWKYEIFEGLTGYYNARTQEEAEANPLNTVMHIPRALVRPAREIVDLLHTRTYRRGEKIERPEVDENNCIVPARELPSHWDEAKVQAIIDRYKYNTVDEAIIALEDSLWAGPYAVFVFPKVLRPSVERLLTECAHLDPKEGSHGRRVRRWCWKMTPRRWKRSVAHSLSRVEWVVEDGRFERRVRRGVRGAWRAARLVWRMWRRRRKHRV